LLINNLLNYKKHQVKLYIDENLLRKIFLYFSLEEMPAGQTPVTVTIVAHNDLVDAVQPGDRYVCGGKC
jgi:DNA replicative helicase MCM subunit Mcm2 (Cdc46/Mcm family)